MSRSWKDMPPEVRAQRRRETVYRVRRPAALRCGPGRRYWRPADRFDLNEEDEI